MHIGFTGTRKPLNEHQESELHFILKFLKETRGATHLHHGDCIGGDAIAHKCAKSLGFFIVIHPPKHKRFRAFCSGGTCLPEKDYLIRNHDIVDAADVLVAAPSEREERLRSGTWATVRYAKKCGRRILFVFPDRNLNLTRELTSRGSE